MILLWNLHNLNPHRVCLRIALVQRADKIAYNWFHKNWQLQGFGVQEAWFQHWLICHRWVQHSEYSSRLYDWPVAATNRGKYSFQKAQALVRGPFPTASDLSAMCRNFGFSSKYSLPFGECSGHSLRLCWPGARLGSLELLRETSVGQILSFGECMQYELFSLPLCHHMNTKHFKLDFYHHCILCRFCNWSSSGCVFINSMSFFYALHNVFYIFKTLYMQIVWQIKLSVVPPVFVLCELQSLQSDMEENCWES